MPLRGDRNAPFSILKGPLASQSSCVLPGWRWSPGKGAVSCCLGAGPAAPAETQPPNPRPLDRISLLPHQTLLVLSFQIFSVYSPSPTLVPKNFSLLRFLLINTARGNFFIPMKDPPPQGKMNILIIEQTGGRGVNPSLAAPLLCPPAPFQEKAEATSPRGRWDRPGREAHVAVSPGSREV